MHSRAVEDVVARLVPERDSPRWDLRSWGDLGMTRYRLPTLRSRTVK